jgi:hypothetical protein
MMSKFETPQLKYDETPSRWPSQTEPSRLSPSGQAAIGAALRMLYDDLVQSRLPDNLLAMVVELQSKEKVCGR